MHWDIDHIFTKIQFEGDEKSYKNSIIVRILPTINKISHSNSYNMVKPLIYLRTNN